LAALLINVLCVTIFIVGVEADVGAVPGGIGNIRLRKRIENALFGAVAVTWKAPLAPPPALLVMVL